MSILCRINLHICNSVVHISTVVRAMQLASPLYPSLPSGKCMKMISAYRTTRDIRVLFAVTDL